MKKIKINFIDFWKGFDPNNNFIINRLKILGYNTKIDENADYWFCSSFGNKHLKYNEKIKIYYTGENDTPDFNLYDYAIGYQHINFQDRYLRFPVYILYENLQGILTPKQNIEEKVLNRKFCNFVYSNSLNADPIRELFYKRLNKYKRIDSGGAFLNNMGGKVKNKLDFIKDYKFTIAFENSSLSGYTTEKLIEPMIVNSIPIYWGNPDVNLDFDPKSFINIHNYSSIEEAIQKIIEIDVNDDLYLKKLSTPWLNKSSYLDECWNNFDKFIENIVFQEISDAKRFTLYGYNKINIKRKKTFSFFLNLPLLRNY